VKTSLSNTTSNACLVIRPRGECARVTVRTLLDKVVVAVAFPLILVLSLVFTQAQRGYAQTQAPTDARTRPATQQEALSGGSDISVTASTASNPPAVALDPEILAKRLAAMEARIAQQHSGPRRRQ
jgi:hypothetical protein